MAAKTLNAKNLEALGAPRLAELLIEISTGSAAHKQRLRLELAGSQSVAEVAREIRKRLISLQRAKTFIDWRKVKAAKKDLETQRVAILTKVAPEDPREAFDLMWQFLGLAESIFDRSDDGSGTLVAIFHQACADAGTLAKGADLGEDVLADKTFAALNDNDYGQYDPLIVEMAPALGRKGLERLKMLVMEVQNAPKRKPKDSEREIIGWGSSGPVYLDEIQGRRDESMTKIALQTIADLTGDVDAFIAQQPAKTRKVPRIAAEIATRLLSAGRAAEALSTLDAADSPRFGWPFEWEEARVEALEALERLDDAQDFRWACFEASLNHHHLRAYLRRLPDFDDIEAEEKAFAHVHRFADVHHALHFFIEWPALAEAAKLCVARRPDLDGDRYELLSPAAEVLSEKQPLAATLLLRAMIDFTLDYGRSSRYKHAARHYVECCGFATRITDYAGLPSHEEYVLALKKKHGKKSGFWSLIV
ncbi:DUF6880 family protein [Allorhizobium pseudoryzae]|uniref:DUF6880 family protein n=1 Tax=Allorhizobium pseudoryzae TaxID=379684 RepID=UPI003CFEF120